MDFKIFCKNQQFEKQYVKEYRDILLKYSKTSEPVPYLPPKSVLQPERTFYGTSEFNLNKDFICLSNEGEIKDYNPYEVNKNISTFCDSCQFQVCDEFCKKPRSQRNIPTRQSIPDHLLGRLSKKQKKKLIKKQHKKEKQLLKETEQKKLNKILYKLIVKTSSEKDAGTRASVWIRIVGKSEKSEPILLQKSASNNKLHKPFVFYPGSNETFHFRSLDFDEIIGLNLKLDDINEEEWRPETLILENLISNQQWIFQVNNWMSKVRQNCKLVLKLNVAKEILHNINYKVTVKVANDSVDEFTGQLYVKLSGDKCTSDKILLVHKKFKKLAKSISYDFDISHQEFGKINVLCVGVCPRDDNKSSSSDDETPFKSKNKKNHFNQKSEESSKSVHKSHGWEDIKINCIIIEWKDPAKELHQIVFQMDEWIGLSPRQKSKFKVLKNPKILSGETKIIKPLEKTNYDVTFYTGNKIFSGTDATVYFQLTGTYGATTDVLEFADYNKKKFEKNSEDTIRVNALDVGTVEKITIWHDNRGMAAGWKLDRIRIVRHLTPTEICNLLEKMSKLSELPREITVRDGKVYRNRSSYQAPPSTSYHPRPKNSHNNSTFDESSSSSLSSKSSSSTRTFTNSSSPSKISQDSMRMNNNQTNISAETINLPYAEETIFLCNDWLSVTDGDKNIKRSLQSQNTHILFSPLSVAINPKQ